MEQLSSKQCKITRYEEKVIQFGAGNFMRAFVDWQIQQMNKQGLFCGSAVVVQPIPTGLESTLIPEQDNCYTVIARGKLGGRILDDSEIVTTISRTINPYQNCADYMALAAIDSLQFIVSNTTEAGIAFCETDKLDDTPQSSFPGKLTALLYRRFQLGKNGFTIIPCELIENNGDMLRACVLRYAQAWCLEQGFVEWLGNSNTFYNSLVDRIVPGYPRELAEEFTKRHGYVDKVMVMCEPYMLWVLQGPSSLEQTLPLKKAGLNVIVTDEMPRYRERKVHLLNAPHTAMSVFGLLEGLDTVGAVMADADYAQFVRNLMEHEIIPSLSQPADALTAYSLEILERFQNPFLEHNLSSILLNSVSKYRARILPMLEWYLQKQGRLPAYMVAALAGLILLYKGDVIAPNDEPSVMEIFAREWTNPTTVVGKLLANETLWGKSLLTIDGLEQSVSDYLRKLQTDGARQTLVELNRRVV